MRANRVDRQDVAEGAPVVLRVEDVLKEPQDLPLVAARPCFLPGASPSLRPTLGLTSFLLFVASRGVPPNIWNEAGIPTAEPRGMRYLL